MRNPVNVTLVRALAGMFLLWPVSQAKADSFRDASELINLVSTKSIASGDTPAQLARHGVAFAASGDAQGRIRAPALALADGTRITSLTYLPESPTLKAQLSLSVDTTRCVVVGRLAKEFGLKDAPIMVSAPAPSVTPSKAALLSPGMVQGSVGKVLLRATYWSKQHGDSANACVSSLVFE